MLQQSARLSAEHHPNLFRPALEKLNDLPESSIRQIVDRIPSNWMTASAREFAIALMRYNSEELRKIVR